MKQSYTYSDVGLYPKKLSSVKSRDEVNVSIDFLDQTISLPVIVAPMETVVGRNLCESLNKMNGLACLPRSSSPEKDFELFAQTNMIPSFSSTRLLEEPYHNNLNIVCLDIANGFNEFVGDVVKQFKENYPDVKIITGNVGSVEGYEYLAECGVDAVRVGIGNGAGCLTSMKTAIGSGQWSLIREIAEYRHRYRDMRPNFSCTYHYAPNDFKGSYYEDYSVCENCDSRSSRKKWPLIIADGGIHSSREIVLAIAAGADICMCGRLFAGVEESPGSVVKYNQKLYKQYAGQASKAIKRSNKYVEGDDTLVPLIGSLSEVWSQVEDGIRSAMSYMNCKSIDDLRFLPDDCFRILSPGSKIERDIHA